MTPPAGRHWRYPPARLDELDAAGLIKWSPAGQPPQNPLRQRRRRQTPPGHLALQRPPATRLPHPEKRPPPGTHHPRLLQPRRRRARLLRRQRNHPPRRRPPRPPRHPMAGRLVHTTICTVIPSPPTVIPAPAGIYACRLHYRSRKPRRWIPAPAGMTVVGASQYAPTP